MRYASTAEQHKVKVKLSLYLINPHTMKTYGTRDVKVHTFLASALDGHM
jgi:hypothetical protein